MKSYFLLLSMVFSLASYSQESSADALSRGIAKRMLDTLNLSKIQFDEILKINEDLTLAKQKARLGTIPADSLSIIFQRIENSRDSLYFPILGSEKFILYKERKASIVRSN